MRIQKKFQGTIPDNKILNIDSDSTTDTYSCAKINERLGNCSKVNQEDVDKWNEALLEPDIYSGTTVPDANLGKDGDIYIQYTA